MIAVILLVVLAIVLVIVRAQSDKKQNKEAKDQPQKATGETWMGAFEAYDVAFNIIKKNPLFTVITAAALLAGYALSVIIQGPPKFGELWFPVGQYVLLLPVALVMPAYSVAVADDKKPSFGSLYRRPLRVFGSLIIAYILAELMILVSALPLFIPAIWTIAWFMMTGFVVMDKNIGPIKALKESKRLAKDHKGKVWGLIGVSVLLSFGVSMVTIVPEAGEYLSAAATGVTTVWASVATAVLYRWLKKNVKV